MFVNYEAIEKRVKNFVNSSKGQQLVDGLAIPEEKMIEAGGIMRGILKQFIIAGQYGDSINKIANTGIIVSPPYKKGKSGNRTLWSIDISFEPYMLYRDSLRIYRHVHQRGEFIGHTGDGIDNIISLLDTGYPYSPDAQMKSVKGFWESRGIFVKTPLERVGDHFVADAVNYFNRVYGSEYFCMAYINAPDEYYMRISDNE